MDLNGLSMFDKDWGTSPQQSTAWAKLTGQPAATLVTRSYPQCLAVGAQTSAERIGTPAGAAPRGEAPSFAAPAPATGCCPA